MEHSPEKSFGFKYEHDGKRYAFDVVATDRQEAESRLASMVRAVCVGEICEAPKNVRQPSTNIKEASSC